MLKVNDIRAEFIDRLAAQDFTIDKTDAKTIEIIGASFLADEAAIFGEVNQDYVNAEIDWYLSMSTNINDIYREKREPPAAWQYSANEYGEINSNYGKLIFDEKYYGQFEMVLRELINNPDGRRATMVYNRPSIWVEFDEDGKNDFICTNAVTYYIRDDQLHAVVQMRSNDVVFGYKNDRAWQKYIMEELCDTINSSSVRMFDDDISPGNLIWQVQNLHVYERHFHLVK
jgi:thymidylate synthase